MAISLHSMLSAPPRKCCVWRFSSANSPGCSQRQAQCPPGLASVVQVGEQKGWGTVPPVLRPAPAHSAAPQAALCPALHTALQHSWRPPSPPSAWVPSLACRTTHFRGMLPGQLQGPSIRVLPCMTHSPYSGWRHTSTHNVQQGKLGRGITFCLSQGPPGEQNQ